MLKKCKTTKIIIKKKGFFANINHFKRCCKSKLEAKIAKSSWLKECFLKTSSILCSNKKKLFEYISLSAKSC